MLLGIKYFIIQPDENFLKDYDLDYKDKYVVSDIKIYKNPYALSLRIWSRKRDF